MNNANDGAWVALGVVFGDALTESIPGLNWAMVTDDSGTYVGLRFGESHLSVSAPTMLLKRRERGEDIDVQHLATELRGFILQHAPNANDV